MINSYEIITEFGALDVNGTDSFEITKQIENILDISKRKTDFTKTINLPGTPFNNEFFKGIYSVNIDNKGFNPVKRIRAFIKCGTNVVMNGWLQLMDIKDDNGVISYDISIAGSLRNIYSSFDDYTLGALDFSEFNHTRNQTNIVDSWDYKIYKNGQQIQLGGPGTGYVYGYALNGNSQDVWDTWYTYDAYPQIYKYTVINKMFEFAGYTVTSKFLESDYYKMQTLNYVGDKIQLSEEVLNQRSVVAGVNPATPFAEITPVRDRGSEWYYNDTAGYYLGLPRESGTVDDGGGELTFRDDLGQFDGNIYTCQNAGRYNVNANFKPVIKITHDDGDDVEFRDGNFEFRWQMFLFKNNGAQILLDSSVDQDDPNDQYGVFLFGLSDGVHPTPWYDIDTLIPFDASAEDLFMEPGDQIRIRFGFRYPEDVRWIGLDDNKHKATLTFADFLDGGFTKIKVELSSNEDFGNSPIDMNQILDRNYKIKDMFLDEVNMYDLIIMDNPNKPNDLIVEPRKDFFKSRQRVWNWDEEEILDKDSTIEITPMSELDAKIYKYTYESDDDFYNKQYTDETGRVYADYTIEVLNDFSDKITTTKVNYSPTVNSSKFIDSRVAPFFIEIEENEFKPFKAKQRVLFYGGSRDLYQGSQLKIKNYPGQPDNEATIVTRYGYTGMWDDPLTPRYSLEFGKPDKIYWDSAGNFPSQNLFEMFHKETLENIIDVNAKLLKVTARVNPKQVAEFDFRDIIFLLGSYWRVNNFVYDPVDGDSLSEFELYKIINLNVINPYTLEIPTSNASCPPDMISRKPKKDGSVILVSSSGLEVTEDCCKSVGGQFKDGICYAKSIRPLIGGIGILAPVKPFIQGTGVVVPTTNPSGPVVFQKNNTTRNSIAVKTHGTGNYVAPGTKSGNIFGNYSSIQKNVEGAFIVGDGIIADRSNTMYTKDIIVDGSINGMDISTLTAATSGNFCSTGILTDSISSCTTSIDVYGQVIINDSLISPTSTASAGNFSWGNSNSSTNLNSVILGGSYNTASGINSAIIGGSTSNVSGNNSVVIGGVTHNITSAASAILGGDYNTASGVNSSVVGGYQNKVTGQTAVIAGGEYNNANGNGSSVIGGSNNTASGSNSSVIGGQSNTASNNHSIVIGAGNSTASGNYSFIFGGSGGNASGNNSVVIGGYYSVSSGNYSTTIGGSYLTASALRSAAIAGASNQVSGALSVALGGTNNYVISSAGSSAIGGNSNTINTSGKVSGIFVGKNHNITAGLNSNSIIGGEYGVISGALTENSAIVGGNSNSVSASRTVVIAGQNITGSASDSVYVPKLNVGILTGTSVVNLGVDANGFVTTGSTGVAFNRYTVTTNLSAGANVITHNLNLSFVIVQLYDSAGKLVIPDEIALTSTNSTTITVSSSMTSVKIIIIG